MTVKELKQVLQVVDHLVRLGRRVQFNVRYKEAKQGFISEARYKKRMESLEEAVDEIAGVLGLKGCVKYGREDKINHIWITDGSYWMSIDHRRSRIVEQGKDGENK